MEESNNFTVRMQGYLVPPVSGAYTLYVQIDDGFAMRLGDNKYYVGCCPNSWDSATQLSATLVGGKAYPLDIYYYEATGDQRCILGWKLPGSSSVVEVPASVCGYKQKNLTRDYTY